jgi:hypothetical protein
MSVRFDGKEKRNQRDENQSDSGKNRTKLSLNVRKSTEFDRLEENFSMAG